MSLKSFAEKTGSFEVKWLPDAQWVHFANTRTPLSLVALREEYPDGFARLNAKQLMGFRRLHAQWLAWDERMCLLLAQPALAAFASTLEATWRLDQLSLCDRATAILGDSIDEASLVESLRLWNDAWNMAFRRGELACKAANLLHPRKADYEIYLRRREPLANLPSHRWLAIRRGERDGALAMNYHLPKTEIRKQLKVYPGLATFAATNMDENTFVDKLILEQMPAELERYLDEHMMSSSIDLAVQSYYTLLSQRPLSARAIGAVYVGGPQRPLGVAIVNIKGKRVCSESIDPHDAPVDAISGHFNRDQVKQVALPESAAASHRLTTLRRELEKHYEIHQVRPAAIAEARQLVLDQEQELSLEEASAFVLAERLRAPYEAWSALDPALLGLAGYQSEIDGAVLRDALEETRNLVAVERELEAEGGAPGSQSNSRPSATALKRLNPLLRTIDDLRPGMAVDGVVTNVSDFGAFVSLGLEREGLVHISELSNEFVSSPDEVVQIGQQVKARVINVDHVKKRISLSLKSDSLSMGKPAQTTRSGNRPQRPRRPSPRQEARSSSNGGGANTTADGLPQTRGEALNALENLFKK